MDTQFDWIAESAAEWAEIWAELDEIAARVDAYDDEDFDPELHLKPEDQ